MAPSDIDQLQVVLNNETRTLMAVILAIMMFNVALSLKVEHFRAVLSRPLQLAGGATAQLIGLPLLTLALVIAINPPASVALGMFVIAACPGGNISNVLTYFARGDSAYSVSLTAISSTAVAVTMPVTILTLAQVYPPTSALIDALDVDAWAFLSQTVSLLGLPLVAGMVLAARWPALADRIRAVLTPGSLIALAGIVVAGVAGNWHLVIAVGALIIPIAVAHNASAFLMGWTVAHGLRLAGAGRRSLTIEVGIQNGGLGLLILLNQFDGLGGAAAIVATWSVWHLIAGSGVAGIFRGVDAWSGRKVQNV